MTGSVEARSVGAVIIHHGEGALALGALESLLASDGPRPIAALVDHGPGSGEALRRGAEATGAIYLRPEKNLGFAGGANRGVEALRARGNFGAFLILNHDVRLDPSAVAILTRHLEEKPNVGIVGPAILLDEGQPRDHRDPIDGRLRTAEDAEDGRGELKLAQSALVWNAGSTIIWPRCRPRSHLYLRPASELTSSPGETGFVCGCALMVRAPLFDRLGGLSEDYFLYFEDADFAFRARGAGFGAAIVPQAVVWHRPGSAAGSLPALVRYLQTRNRILFSRRWAPPGLAPRVARWAFALARIARGAPERRGATDGLKGRMGPPPADILGIAD